MKNLIRLLIIAFVAVGCSSEVLQKETDTYQITITKASNFHQGFTNTEMTQKGLFDLNAERISLKELFKILLEAHPADIKFEKAKMLKEFYQVEIKQKKEGKAVQKAILNDILQSLHLDLEQLQYKNFSIEIQDSAKLNNFRNNTEKNVSTVFSKADFKKVENATLKEVAKVLSKQYNEDFSSDVEERIDYKWEKTPLAELRQKFTTDLGVSFKELPQTKTIYLLKEK